MKIQLDGGKFIDNASVIYLSENNVTIKTGKKYLRFDLSGVVRITTKDFSIRFRMRRYAALPGSVGSGICVKVAMWPENADENPFDAIVVCPHCGNKVRYGDIYIKRGVVYCDKCSREVEELLGDISKNLTDIEKLLPYGIKWEDVKRGEID